MTLFLRPFGEALTEALQPVKRASTGAPEMEQLLLELGWNVDIDNSTIGNIGTAFTTITTIIDDSVTLFTDVQNGSGNQLQNITSLISKIKDFFDTIKTFDPSSTPGVPVPMDQSAFWTEIMDDLPGYLVSMYLRDCQPFFYGAFLTIGVIEITDEVPSGTLAGYKVNYKKYTVDISKLGDFVSDAPLALKNIYHWNDPNTAFDHHKLLYNLEQFAIGMRLQAVRETPLRSLYNGNGYFTDSQVETQKIESLAIPIISSYPIDDSGYLSAGALLMPIPKTPGTNAIPEGLLLTPIAEGSLASTIPLTPQLSLLLSAQFGGTGVFGVKIFPDGVELDTNLSNGLIDADLKIIGTPEDPDKPWILIGAANQTRLEIEGFMASLGVHGVLTNLEVTAGLGTSEGAKIRFVLQPSDGDSFISKILGSNPVELEWDGILQWSSLSGFGIQGHAGFQYELPVNKTLGPLLIQSITLQSVSKSGGGAGISVGANATLKLGPFTATIEGVGAELLLKKKAPNESAGVLGNIEVDFGFKPPTGLGLSLKNDTLTGAGYLSFNKDEGRYVGFLELRVKGTIHIKVFGILTTKLPGGAQGYSLLLLVLVDDFKPIPIGFGFTINGFGGLIALHRRMNSEFLLNAAMSGSLTNILAPENPVQNINTIIDTLESAFPIEEGRFTFGPMLKIGWGSPTLITIDVGVFMEFPDPEEVVIIGLIRTVLPNEASPVIQLQIAFAGVINFEKKFIKFNAALINSRLLGFPLDGQMAFRMYWGDQPNFILSVGGFHPDYKAPAELQGLRRMTMNLVEGDNPRITLTAYFALTSNSVQFGAQVDFYYDIGDKWPFGHFDVVGYLGFHALIYFNPFHFRINIDAGISVRCDGDSILSITLRGMLEGPKQWHVQGYFRIEIWGLKWDKDFDWTSGEPDYTTLPDVQVLPKLVTALQDPTNWRATPITGVPLLVTLRELTVSPNDLVVHPQTSLAVNQKIVPLNTSISRFGNARPVTNTQFNIELSYDPNPGSYLAKNELKEYFSPNEFFDLNEGERLGRASFEPFASGAEVSSTSNAITTGDYREMQYLYETIVMDSRNYPIYIPTDEPLEDQAQDIFRDGNAAALSVFGADTFVNGDYAPPAMVNAGRSFAVAKTSDLSQVGSTARTQTEAQLEIELQLALNPALEGKLQIVNTFEL